MQLVEEYYDDYYEVGYAEELRQPIYKRFGLWRVGREERLEPQPFGFARALSDDA